MAKTYSPSEVSVRDQVRGQMGDTGFAGPMILADETIDSLLGRFGPVEGAARCAERMAAYYAQVAMDWMETNRREMYRDREKSMLELAKRIRSQGFTDIEGNTQGSVSVGQLVAPDLTSYRVD